MESVFELIDITHEENYFTIGVFETLEDALDAAKNSTEPPIFENDYDFILMEIRQRQIGKIGWGDMGKICANIRLERDFPDEGDEDGRWIISIERV